MIQQRGRNMRHLESNDVWKSKGRGEGRVCGWAGLDWAGRRVREQQARGRCPPEMPEAAVMPGTTRVDTPRASKYCTSSPPRPNT